MRPEIAAVWMSDNATSPVTRRQVDQQVIHFAPFDISQELLHHVGSIGPRHTSGLSLGMRKPIDINFTPYFSIGRIAFRVAHGRFIGSKHQRHVGSVNVCVQQRDFLARAGETDGQIHGNGGLTDSAFA